MSILCQIPNNQHRMSRRIEATRCEVAELSAPREVELRNHRAYIRPAFPDTNVSTLYRSSSI